MKQIKLIKGWAGRAPGTVLAPEQPDVARLLVVRGVAEYVEEAKPKKPKLQPWVKTDDK